MNTKGLILLLFSGVLAACTEACQVENTGCSATIPCCPGFKCNNGGDAFGFCKPAAAPAPSGGSKPATPSPTSKPAATTKTATTKTATSSRPPASAATTKKPATTAAPVKPTTPAAPSPSASSGSAFELPHRGCYFTNWAQYRTGNAKHVASDIDATLCTYIMIAFGSITDGALATREWNDEDTYKALNKLRSTNPKLKILLSIGGATMSDQVASMAAAPTGTQQAFAKSALTQLRKWGLDGLDIDWEFPEAGQKAQFTSFVKTLKSEFEKDTKQPRLLVTAAVQITTHTGYDGPALNNLLDLVQVMAYDLHGAWDKTKTGHEAPLLKGPFGTESPLSVENVMKSWVDMGFSKNKLVVGLPLYGRGWTVSNSNAGLGAPATGPMPASKYTGEEGNWPYYEICEWTKNTHPKVTFDNNIKAVYATGDGMWVGYDDKATIIEKTKWAKTNGYAGVYVWDVAQDDFKNICGNGKYPLLAAVKSVLKP